MINPYKDTPVRKTYDISLAPAGKDCPCGEKGQIAFIDNDGDGKYSADRDSTILYDFNGDGRYDQQDAKKTAHLVKLMQNRSLTDLNGDGVTTASERRDAAEVKEHLARLDRNRDGALEGGELKRIALGSDYNDDGYFSANALGSKTVDMTGKTMSFMELELRDEFKERWKSGPHDGPKYDIGGHLICGPLPWNITDGPY